MSYFTIKPPIFLVPSDKVLDEYERINKFMKLLENSGVAKIIKSVNPEEKKCKGRKGYYAYHLFAAIIYCFVWFKASLRDIEDKCIYDLRIIYIMEGEMPDHSVIGDFINKYMLPYRYEIFTLITKQIIKELKLNISTSYLDGTKIEANANKYKNVWKPVKYHKRLNLKIIELLYEMGYELTIKDDELITSAEYNILLKLYAQKENIIISNIPTGRGCKRTASERMCIKGYEYLLKILEYEEKEAICGENRNSYYKTDTDATAMVLKKDYYSKLSHDFHAGYNIQVMVSNLLILMFGVYQDRNDFYTLQPMCEKFYKHYNFYPENLCADSGYGNYDNYIYLKEKNINSYVKFLSWKGESSGRSPQLFKVDDDYNIKCLNGNIGANYETDKKHKIKNSQFYIFYGCNECNYSHKCKAFMKEESKLSDYRIKEISLEYEMLKNITRENLLSPKGIEIRINRSIQVEGTYGQIKQNMNYQRIRRRGVNCVECEIMLMCLGVNIRRYLYNLDRDNIKDSYWEAPSTLQSEVFPECKAKKRN